MSRMGAVKLTAPARPGCFRQKLSAPLDVEVKVYTLAGRLIQSLQTIASGEPMVRVPWDGRDRDGDLLANGVYLYKLVVRTTDGTFASEALGKLTVLEAVDLVKKLEETWGVSAAAPVAVAAAGPAAAVVAEPVEEKTEFDVVIKDAGPKKIETIKVIRQLTNLGLVEAKTMAETAGAKVLTAVSKQAAADAKGKLEAAGAVVEVA